MIDITISDHFLVRTTLNLKGPKPTSTFITTRSYKDFNSDSFTEDMAKAPWSIIGLFDEFEDKVDCFNRLFLQVLELHAPLKTFKVRNTTTPFITAEIKSLMNQRDNQHRLARLSSTPSDWEAYRSLRRDVKTKIRQAEISYVRKEINSNKENKTSIWKTVRRCLNPSGTSCMPYSRNCVDVANDFNSFFSSVGEIAAQKAKTLAHDFNLPSIETVLRNPVPDRDTPKATFSFHCVSTTKVQDTIMQMASNKSPGHDKVSMKVIKACLPNILQVVTDMINESLSEGIFPKTWKTAEVIPHLKDGEHEVASNNRPISLLPALSKVVERIVHDQFTTFLTTNALLSVHQSGNKKLHSTETLGILFTSHLYKAIDDKKITAALLIDLSKAFDSINHEALLKKLGKLGISSIALKWFTSYLSDRVQRVRINTSLSDPLVIKHGVPQGSILGPLLFNIYINDLPSICKNCKVESYVDDSKLYISFPNKDIDKGLEDLKQDLLRIAAWCTSNDLLINPDKTKFCVFGTRQLLSRSTIPSITFLGKELSVVSTIKDLGIILDSTLSFNDYIKSSVSSLMSKLCMINRIRHLLDPSTLSIVINSLVFSKLFYCSGIWSGTSKSNISKLQLVQNFAARILSGKKKYEHITPTLKQLKLLPISDALYLRDATLMYKCMNSLAPHYLTSMFVKRSDVHDRNTRNGKDLQIPKCRTVTAQQCFSYRGVKLWNSIPTELKDKKSLKLFKTSLKRSLLERWLKNDF